MFGDPPSASFCIQGFTRRLPANITSVVQYGNFCPVFDGSIDRHTSNFNFISFILSHPRHTAQSNIQMRYCFGLRKTAEIFILPNGYGDRCAILFCCNGRFEKVSVHCHRSLEPIPTAGWVHMGQCWKHRPHVRSVLSFGESDSEPV